MFSLLLDLFRHFLVTHSMKVMHFVLQENTSCVKITSRWPPMCTVNSHSTQFDYAYQQYCSTEHTNPATGYEDGCNCALESATQGGTYVLADKLYFGRGKLVLASTIHHHNHLWIECNHLYLAYQSWCAIILQVQSNWAGTITTLMHQRSWLVQQARCVIIPNWLQRIQHVSALDCTGVIL